MREILESVGQAAIELTCSIPGHREFATVFMCRRDAVQINTERRFPYLADCELIYRLVRFRVPEEIIDNDVSCAEDELLDLQQIYLPHFESVQYLLDVWKIAPRDFRKPCEVEIPI